MSSEPSHAARGETSDTRPRFMPIGAAILLAAVVGFTPLPLALLPERAGDEALRSPLPDYPEPRVRFGPRNGKRKHEEETRKLHVSAAVRIPIEQAMREIAEEKIAGWPSPGGAPAVAEGQTRQANPAAEQPHEAAARSDRAGPGGAHKSRCQAESRSQRHCLRAKAGRGAPAVAEAPRRRRP